MKHLYLVTVILWLAILAGYIWLRDFILKPSVVMSLVVLFSTLLPVSFWHLQRAGRRLAAGLLAGIFFFNIAMIAIGLFQIHGIMADLDRRLVLFVNPRLAELALVGAGGEERERAAREVYRRHGISLVFIDDGGAMQRFSPKSEDNEHLFAATDEKMAVQRALVNIFDQNILLLTLILLHMVLFVGILLILVLYDRPVGWRPLSKTD